MAPQDLDGGMQRATELFQACDFPWIVSNAKGLDGHPLAGLLEHVIVEAPGCKMGIIGVIETEWVDTLGSVNAEDVHVEDFTACAERLAARLRAEGADMVLALAHMRIPNDLWLARNAPGIDAVLGGHDHFAAMMATANGGVVIKSGTDFLNFTELAAWPLGSEPADIPSTLGWAPEDVQELSAEHNVGGFEAQAPRAAVLRGKRWVFAARLVDVPAGTQPDPAVQAVVDLHTRASEAKMDCTIAWSAQPLESRFHLLRTQEVNIGSWMADRMRESTCADIALLNSGTLRADEVMPAGRFTCRQLLKLLPMADPIVKLELPGAAVLQALEGGLSAWPRLEGRFPQVAGIKFEFDGTAPPGARVVLGSVYVQRWLSLHEQGEWEVLQPASKYTLACKAYMAQGRDGYSALQEFGTVLIDDEQGMTLPTTVRVYLHMLKALNLLSNSPRSLAARAAEVWRLRALHDERAFQEDLPSPPYQLDAHVCGRIVQVGDVTPAGSPVHAESTGE